LCSGSPIFDSARYGTCERLKDLTTLSQEVPIENSWRGRLAHSVAEIDGFAEIPGETWHGELFW